MFWLIFKIIDFFERPPKVSESLKEKMRQHYAVAKEEKLSDNSHTPIITDANDEVTRYKSDEYQGK